MQTDEDYEKAMDLSFVSFESDVAMMSRRFRADDFHGATCPRPSCGELNPPEARFCSACGKRLVENAARRGEDVEATASAE